VEATARDEIRWLRTLLSPKERQVLDLRTDGASNRRIVRELGLSVRTVERMFEEIRAKWAAALREE
jgi:FixJ family two-component response regulator